MPMALLPPFYRTGSRANTSLATTSRLRIQACWVPITISNRSAAQVRFCCCLNPAREATTVTSAVPQCQGYFKGGQPAGVGGWVEEEDYSPPFLFSDFFLLRPLRYFNAFPFGKLRKRSPPAVSPPLTFQTMRISSPPPPSERGSRI